jgi:hypothetical protein
MKLINYKLKEQNKESMKTNVYTVFERTDKIGKLLAKLAKRKRIPKLIKGDITIDTTESQWIIIQYFETLYAN